MVFLAKNSVVLTNKKINSIETIKKGVSMKKFGICLVALILMTISICYCMTQKDINVCRADSELDLSSKSACLMDFESGEVLFEKDSKERKPVASMVKMMTILLTIEDLESGRINLNDKVFVSENASGMGGSQVFIEAYSKYSVEDMLKSVIMASANDASVALAEHLAGSEESFVAKMNKRAKELAMNDTNYANCTGLPAPEQYSSAFDSALLLCNVTKHQIYHNYSSIWMDKLVHSGGRETELVNTNKLIRYYQGCDGGKTGSTSEAGCCLSATAKRNDMRLISVIVGAQNSKTRFNECSKLFNYGFSNFENKKLVSSTELLASLPVLKGKIDKADLHAKEDFVALVKKGDNTKYSYELRLPEKIKAPIQSGEVVGQILIMKNSQLVKEIDIVASCEIEKISLADSFQKIVANW